MDELQARAAGAHDVAAIFDSLDVAPSTKSSYERAFRLFVEWTEGNGLAPLQIKRADIIAYRDHLSETCSPGTVRAYLTPLKAFYRRAAAEGVLPNVAEGVRPPKQRRGFAKDALTPEQAARVLEGLEGEGLRALRDYALVNLLMRVGLRSIEAARADIGDLRSMGDKRVLWVQGKGRSEKDDFAILTAEAYEPIDAYLKERGETDKDAPLFAGIGNRNHEGRMTTRSISRICKEAFRAAGIDSERVSAHSLRHTAVTAALMGGATIQEAQAMARHSDISTTTVYAHNVNRVENPAEEKASEYFKGKGSRER